MQPSRKLTHALLALFALVVISATASAQVVGPGQFYPPQSEVSDQKAGSILFYNYYTSGAADGNAQNTRINITNTSVTNSAFVHLFFVRADDCGVADSFLCLTQNQTATFLASDVDPGTTGYIVAVASDGRFGGPVVFNHLIGDEYFKTTAGYAANLGAEAFAALGDTIGGFTSTDFQAVLNFSGQIGGYNRVPRVLAVDNFGSAADDNDTLLIINRVGGNLGTGASTVGTLFAIAYNDGETPGSLSFSSGRCQFQGRISAFRTSPPIATLVPSGRSGWLKFYNPNADNGYLGAVVNASPTFSGGHNLHKLTFTTNTTLTIPIFPPSC